MPVSAVDLNLLPVLDALLQESSVTRAAQRVGLSQSATSHALARLRALLDDPLLVRTRNGMAPTARGRALAGPVRDALDQIEQALLPPQPFDPGRSARTFSLSLEDAGQVGLLPLLAERLAKEAPAVDLRVHPARDRHSAQPLANGSVDLALAVSPEPSADLHAEEVFRTPYVCIARPGHPGIGKRLTLHRFGALGHVVLESPGSVDAEIDRALAERSRTRRAALRVPSSLPIPWLVARSDLIATVPALLLGLDREHPRVTQHTPPVPLAPVTGALVWHERTHRSPDHRWLRQIVRDACRRLAPRP